MAPAEAPDTFFKYKSGAYLYINSTDDNTNPGRKKKEKTERCRFGYLLSQTCRHTNMINSHETAPGEWQIHFSHFEIIFFFTIKMKPPILQTVFYK